jgi:hypothetical protein
MNSPKLLATGMVLAALILVTMQPVASADGIPLTRMEFHSTLRENRQIAFIKVSETLRFETLDLFLSVVSLEPGNNLTIMIPLRTTPTSVSAVDTTEYQFKAGRGYQGIQRLAEAQNHAGSKLGDEFEDSATMLARFQVGGFFNLLFIGMGASNGGNGHYVLGEGMSMDLISFNSTDSLESFYASQGLEVPENVREIIERNGDFSVGLINAVTRPPIAQEKFDRLAERCPDQLRRLREFLAENPSITTYGYGGYPYYDPYYSSQSELSRIINSIDDYSLRYEFSELVSATYGMSEAAGTAISFRLPLKDGIAFFPLGTTPAWSGVHSTQVIFEIQDSLMIDFDRKADEVFSDGKHYYVWDFGEESPDFDLEGRVKAAGLGTDINRIARQTEQYVYENSENLGIGMSIILFLGLWSLGFWSISRWRNWEGRGAKRGLALLLMGASCFAASIFLTIIIGIWLAIVCVAVMEHKHLPPGSRWPFPRSPKRILIGILGFMLMATGIICLLGLLFTRYEPMSSISLGLGLAGSVFILLHLTFADNPSYEKRISAWALYLMFMGASFLMISSFGVAYCTMAFVIFLALQTFLYIQYVKALEEEPAPEPVEWWMDAQT